MQASGYFSRNDGEGIAANDKVREIAFSSLVLEQGSNSDIVEISPTHVIVLRLNEHIPSTAMPLESVSSRIENILKVKNGHKQTKDAATEAKAKLEAGESIKSIQTDGVRIENIASVGRTDRSKIANPSVLQSAFELIPGKDGQVSIKEVDVFNGDVALVVLNKINMSEEVEKTQLDQVAGEVNRESAIRDFSSALQAMKDHAEIDNNPRIIER